MSEQSAPASRHGIEATLDTASLTALRELIEVGGHVGPAVARRANLSTSELTALEHLIREPMGPVDLARALGVTSAAASGIVDRLAQHGHAVRRPHDHDGRRTQVLITESGRAEVFGYLMPMFTALAALDGDLTDAERDVVARYLRGATDAMRHLL